MGKVIFKMNEKVKNSLVIKFRMESSGNYFFYKIQYFGM